MVSRLAFLCPVVLLALVMMASMASAQGTGDTVKSGDDNVVKYRPKELASVDQLVLILSNAADTNGKRQEVLVFLGRTKSGAWDTVGNTDLEELGAHWRSVSERQLEEYRRNGISSENLEKLDLAVELSIVQFLRLYQELRADFLGQPDQKARLAVLANDNRYEKLRQLGREGLFQQDSLVSKVIARVANEATGAAQ